MSDTDNQNIEIREQTHPDYTACPICGGKMSHREETSSGICFICGKSYKSHYFCENGCFICSPCYGSRSFIKLYPVMRAQSKNPFEIIEMMMDTKGIGLGGCIHHAMVPLAIFIAFKNTAMLGKEFTDTIFDIFREEIQKVPISLCKTEAHCCGIPISCGNTYAMAIPLFCEILGIDRYKDGVVEEKIKDECQRVVLENRGEDKLCCKRIAYIETLTLAKIANNYFKVELQLPKMIKCKYAGQSAYCLKERCEFYEGIRIGCDV